MCAELECILLLEVQAAYSVNPGLSPRRAHAACDLNPTRITATRWPSPPTHHNPLLIAIHTTQIGLVDCPFSSDVKGNVKGELHPVEFSLSVHH